MERDSADGDRRDTRVETTAGGTTTRTTDLLGIPRRGERSSRFGAETATVTETAATTASMPTAGLAVAHAAGSAATVVVTAAATATAAGRGDKVPTIIRYINQASLIARIKIIFFMIL